jgi:hypothetical protein
MKNREQITVAVLVAAGSTLCFGQGEQSPTPIEPSVGRVVHAAHIYFNLATGERIISLAGDDQTTPADNGSSGPIWSISGESPCPDGGFTTSSFFVVDNNAGTTSLATAATTVSWGDIALNTVVDHVRIEWITDHDDVDLDSDGIGDGVVGLGGRWTWWDADNGRAGDRSTRMPLISLTFQNLPGDLDPSADIVAAYTADIDLGGTFTSSLVFEIGDSDGDLQGAAFHNANIANFDNDFDGNPDSDLDGDGLFDWSWGVRFFQPGTADLDGDGQLDGDFADSMKPIGISKGIAPGHIIDNGDGTFGWEEDFDAIDYPTGAGGAYSIYGPPDGDGEIHHAGFFWDKNNEFSCGPNGPTIPYAGFTHTLFGPSNPGVSCQADINGDGDLNFFDISAFLSQIGDPELCDYNGDGACNFFDISDFLADIVAGCP